MEPRLVAFAIALSFSLLCLLAAYRLVYVPAATSRFRQDLFDLRRRLFLLAADGRVPFNSLLYGRLRISMNAALRYAERVSFTRLVVTNLTAETEEEHQRDVLAKLSTLEKGVCPEVDEIRDEFSMVIARYMIATSPLLMLMIAAALVLWPFAALYRFLRGPRVPKMPKSVNRYVQRGAERLLGAPC